MVMRLRLRTEWVVEVEVMGRVKSWMDAVRI
jgi:hypothetical protein